MEKIEVGRLFWGEGYFMSESNALRYSIDVADSFPGQLTAMLTSDNSGFSFDLLDGEPRTYHGCDLFNNSFMPPPKLRSETCLSVVEVTHYTGNLELPQSVENDLRTGVLTLKLLSDTGRLVDGLIQRETPPRLSIQTNGSTNTITWESDGRCTLEATDSLGGSENWFVVTNIFFAGAANSVSHQATNSGMFYRLGWQQSD